MPELPEVEALALDLGGRLDGRAIATVHLAAFSALKTFDPPVTALQGTLVDGLRGTGDGRPRGRRSCRTAGSRPG